MEKLCKEPPEDIAAITEKEKEEIKRLCEVLVGLDRFQWYVIKKTVEEHFNFLEAQVQLAVASALALDIESRYYRLYGDTFLQNEIFDEIQKKQEFLNF